MATKKATIKLVLFENKEKLKNVQITYIDLSIDDEGKLVFDINYKPKKK